MNILLEKEGLFEIFSLTTMCLYGGVLRLISDCEWRGVLGLNQDAALESNISLPFCRDI